MSTEINENVSGILYEEPVSWYNKAMINAKNMGLSEFLDVTDFPPEKYMQVNNCGMKKYFGQNHTLLRSKGRKDYYLLYVALGWLSIEYGDEMVRIDRGKCVVFLPNTPQLIKFSSEGNPTIFYVHFTGAAIDELVEHMGLESITLCKIHDCAAFEILFNRLVKNFLPLKAVSGRRPIYVPKVNGLLLQLLDFLTRSKAEKAKKPEQDAITAALLYINEHFREEVNLEKYAEIAHLSLGRFSHLFTKKTGISPHKYVLSLRIEEAKELLMYSSMSVSEVAASIGIAEPSYFSRIFRKCTGHSPTDYRNQG